MKKNTKKTKNPVNENTPPQGVPQFVSWADATLEDKVERCNVVIREVSELLGDLQKRMSKQEQNFFGHKHVGESLVGPISQFSAPSEQKEEKPRTERWF
jgi:hypothetical protein